jgi:hypothetical protein
MESSIDLNINNYTFNDLLNFFKLKTDFSPEELHEKEDSMISNILSTNNYEHKYKLNLINFIKDSKKKLMPYKNNNDSAEKLYHEIKNEMNLYKNQYQQILQEQKLGKIMNPFSNDHQPLDRQKIPKNDISPYKSDIKTTLYVFNTIARNDFFNTTASNCYFDLPFSWKNVLSINLSSINVPNVRYAYNNELRTNQIYIEEETTGIKGLVTLPEGNYVPYNSITNANFLTTLENAISTQLGTGDRFKVTIDLAKYNITISNTTYNFIMNTIIKDPNDLCSPYSDSIINVTSGFTINNKSQLNIPTYLQTMSYLMGFREIYYSGSNSYTGESIFTSVYSDYLYLELDDYTGSQQPSSTVGVLGKGILAGNILGIIPLTSGVFTTTFDNNADFIYKKREYFGPVDIYRFSIKLINQAGNVVNLHDSDYSFSLEVNTKYDLFGVE